jgi:hypothetical protein
MAKPSAISYEPKVTLQDTAKEHNFIYISDGAFYNQKQMIIGTFDNKS